MKTTRPILLSLLLVALCGGVVLPAEDQSKPTPSHPKTTVLTKSEAKKEPESAEAEAADQEAGLETIAEYQIVSGVFRKDSSPGDSLELINPFQARKPRSFHGVVYLYHRNDFFDARNFFDPVDEKLPEFKRNQFGVTLGTSLPAGLNVMGAYDGLRIVQGSTIVSHIPTRAMKTGDFSFLEGDLIDPLTGKPFPDNQIASDRIHPVSQKLLGVYPDPNSSDPDRNFVNNQPEVSNHDSLSFRVDQEVSQDFQMYYRYSVVSEDGFYAHSLPSFGRYVDEMHQDARVSLNRRFSHRLSTEVYVGFQRRTAGSLSPNSGSEGLLESLGISGLSVDDPVDEGYPQFAMSGYVSMGDRSNSPTTSVQNYYFGGGGLNWILETHSLHFGGSLRAQQINNDRTGGVRRGSFQFSGYYTGDSFADFLLGIPDTARRGIGTNRSDIRGRRWEFYFSDEWRITPRLRWSGTIRYNYFEPFHSVPGNVSTFYPLLFEPTQGEIIEAHSERAEQLGFTGIAAGSLIFPDLNDWAPSMSLSYNPLGSNRLVFRASFYTHYDAPDADDYIELMTRNYPFYDFQVAQSSSDYPDIDLSNPFETLVPVERTMQGIDPRLRTPTYRGWRLGAETRLGSHWDLSAMYRGSRGTGIPRPIDANVPLPGPGLVQPRRPNPEYGTFSIFSGGAASTQHTLQADLRRRLVDGFSVESGFRWTKQLDDITYRSASNPRDLRSERAVAGWTPSKRFDLKYILDLPFGSGWTSGWLERTLTGWRLSGITRVQDGRYFTVLMDGDSNNDGVKGDRPDRIGSGVLEHPTVDKWFETEHFAEPVEYGFGTAGRNILSGPSYQNWDISLSKRTTLADGHFLELRLEMFNAFNHTNFYNPDTTFGTSVFGKIFGAARSREIEVALKYSF